MTKLNMPWREAIEPALKQAAVDRTPYSKVVKQIKRISTLNKKEIDQIVFDIMGDSIENSWWATKLVNHLDKIRNP